MFSCAPAEKMRIRKTLVVLAKGVGTPARIATLLPDVSASQGLATMDSTDLLRRDCFSGGADGTRTRDLRRDRPAF